MAHFSNYGSNSVHLSAPGLSIYSTIPNNKYGYKYKVMGIVCHLAKSYNEGHYYSIVRKNDLWYKANDWRYDEYEYCTFLLKLGRKLKLDVQQKVKATKLYTRIR